MVVMVTAGGAPSDAKGAVEGKVALTRCSSVTGTPANAITLSRREAERGNRAKRETRKRKQQSEKGKRGEGVREEEGGR